MSEHKDNNVGERELFSPDQLALAIGKKHTPTAEQAAVIEGAVGPKLVVAGAGAGKTETMAARVVYLVANGLVRPEQVLGLTFTRKAAQQLEQRIRSQLLKLKGSGILVPGSPAAEAVDNVVVNVSTYDSFAGDVVREFGLLVPFEPGSRIITAAEHYAIAHDVVSNWEGELIATQSVDAVVETVLALANSMDGQLSDPEAIAEHERDFRLTAANLDKTRKDGPDYSKELQGWLDKQRLRLQYLPLLRALKERQRELKVTTFGEQMAVAAHLAEHYPQVGATLRGRYKVVMLDEYQDTSHAQRVLLRGLFGKEAWPGLSVTAVGDPMQSIYGWRGATAENLAAFVEDFPLSADTPAPKDQLTTSWRNPSGVLDMANDVATAVFGAGPRPVDPLSARAGADPGDIQLAYFETAEEELEFMAQRLRGFYDVAQAAGEEFTAAVLVRNNSHSAAAAAALNAVGVPNEIIGLGGLLWEPEVQDVVALATLLVRPQDTAAALRILAGPIVGLSLADLQALHGRARNLGGGPGGIGGSSERVRWEVGKDPVEHLRAQLVALQNETPEQVPGLGDAIADLGERSRYSADGIARIENLASRLRSLRTYSLGKSLGDVFADIEAAFTIRTEVLARGHAGGTTHLDKFHDVVAAYPGATLTGLLDYLALAKEKEDGLAPGEVPAQPGRVHIMTGHKSKGLEYQHVCVIHADSQTYTAKASTFLTVVEKVPGDEDVIDPGEGTKRSDFSNACKAFLELDREHQAEETARLFYVAMTRTESTLLISGSGTNNAKGKSKKGPYRFLELLAHKYPEHVVHWEVPETPVESSGEERPFAESLFPVQHDDAAVREAARQVAQARDEMPELRVGEVYSQWELEANALIAEWEAQLAPEVVVELPRELTASDMVALSTDPKAFARRQRRPVPFKPNSYAKRGTAFHSWLEQLFGGAALLSEDELPGIDEPMPAEELEALKEKFQASEWAQRTPFGVEVPFEITIGEAVVRGRMDAVFKEPDGSWLIIDWKTGRPPQGKAMRDAEIQLAVYAEAWRRLQPAGTSDGGVPAPVRAGFHYVADGYTHLPARLAEGEELKGLLRHATESFSG